MTAEPLGAPIEKVIDILQRAKDEVASLRCPDEETTTAEESRFALAMAETMSVLDSLIRTWGDEHDIMRQFGNGHRSAAVRQVTNQEQQRHRLADRLRNGPAHLLANVAMELRSSLCLIDDDPSVVRAALEELVEELDEGLQEIREIIDDLRLPLILRDMGVRAWLQDMAQRYRHTYGLQVEIEAPAQAPRFPQPVEVVLFRVAQEAMRNVVKHARARRLAAWT